MKNGPYLHSMAIWAQVSPHPGSQSIQFPLGHRSGFPLPCVSHVVLLFFYISLVATCEKDVRGVYLYISKSFPARASSASTQEMEFAEFFTFQIWLCGLQTLVLLQFLLLENTESVSFCKLCLQNILEFLTKRN